MRVGDPFAPESDVMNVEATGSAAGPAEPVAFCDQPAGFL